MSESSSISFSSILRGGLAILLTFGLLVFLAATRMSFSASAPKTLSVRSLETTAPVSLPAPPPASEAEQAPQPDAPTPDLPKLEIEFDSIAPPVKASLSQNVKLQLQQSSFAPQAEQSREHMLFAASSLDSQPRLISRPKVSFPKSQRNRGIKEGKVTLEVVISNKGKTTVRRVLKSSHPDFTKMASLFASGSRFSPPKKDGRPVTALFKWPIILRP